MAVYRGKIDLVNMTAAEANGIQRTEVLYAVSSSGTQPPEFTGAELITAEGGMLDFNQAETFFYTKDGELWVQQNGELIQLNIEDNCIAGIIGENSWSESIPEVPQGFYLWTKTIFYYTDGTCTVSYTVSKQGEDGKEGPAGVSTTSYKINCNQTEILKFVDKEDNLLFSPEILVISITKDDPQLKNGSFQITDLQKDKFLAEVYDIKAGTWSQLREHIVLEDSCFKIKLKEIDPKNLNEKEEYLATVLLAREECILKISYTQYEGDNRFNIVEFINVRYGMNKDMASLSIQANGIVAAMQDSKLFFDSNGLTIENGAFRIQKTTEDNEVESLLYTDNLGNLTLKGNINAEGGYFKGDITGATGTFSGNINAEGGYFKGDITGATGTFSGELKATTGVIGGFKIGEVALESVAKNDNNISKIILNGKEGRIEAENIILGTGAVIKDYIKIGEQVELKKPKNNTDSFIRVIKDIKDENGNVTERYEILTLSADGSMKIGYGEDSIIFSGAEGSIISQNYQNGLGWKISNTESIFNDVTIRGSIRASVLEYGETQAIGGALLVRPSSRITKTELKGNSTTLTLEEVKGFKVGDFCCIDVQTSSSIEHRYYEIESVDESSKTITVKGDSSNSYGKPIVNFGKSGDNVGISINGSIDNSFSTPQSISVFEFNQETKTINPRIILGKLPNEKTIYGYAAGTYGLYAENVLLKGSLVTQTRTDDALDTLYSGINTLYNQGEAPNSINSFAGKNFSNPGEILLWAGAKSDEKTDIENSNFFVDRNGNLFAGSGYFKGTIITDATITASMIETAVLRGTGEAPALTIENATNGIYFSATGDNLFPKVDGWIKAGAGIAPKHMIRIGEKNKCELSFKEDTEAIIIYRDKDTSPLKEEAVPLGKFYSFYTPDDCVYVSIYIKKYKELPEFQSNFEKLQPSLRKYSTVFEVTKDSITANVPNFNFNNNFSIGEEGSLIVPNLYVIGEDAGTAAAEEQEAKKAIMLDKYKISYTENFNQIEKSGTIKSYIDFTEGLSFSSDGSKEILKIQEQQVRIQGENTSLYIEEYVNYGDVAQYKPAIKDGVVIGYDLFIE